MIKCESLRNVPREKYLYILGKLQSIQDIRKRAIIEDLYSRYFEANIPFNYWKLEMDNFSGDEILYKKYIELTQNIEKTYMDGKIICFAGNYGYGKTMASTNILKKALAKGYFALYTTLGDIIAVMLTENKFAARKELLNVNFLLIDEFDSRHFSSQSEKSSDLFGRIFEDILRGRAQNGLPLYLCTNSPNPLAGFQGSIKESLTSLWNYVELVPVLGKDFRKTLKQ